MSRTKTQDSNYPDSLFVEKEYQWKWLGKWSLKKLNGAEPDGCQQSPIWCLETISQTLILYVLLLLHKTEEATEN